MRQDITIFIDPLTGKTGIVNKEGRQTVRPEYDKIEESENEYFWASKAGTWFYISYWGHILFNLKPGDNTFAIQKNYEIDETTVCLKVSEKWYLFNKLSYKLTSLDYDDVDHFLLKPMGQKKVKKDGKWAICDGHLNPITPFRFNRVDVILGETDYASVLDINDKYSFIDIFGNLIFENIYDYADSFFDGLAVVSKDGKYGVIDLNGSTKIPFVYDYLENQFAFIHAEKDGYFWSIDFQGVLIPEYVVEKVEKLNNFL